MKELFLLTLTLCVLIPTRMEAQEIPADSSAITQAESDHTRTNIFYPQAYYHRHENSWPDHGILEFKGDVQAISTWAIEAPDSVSIENEQAPKIYNIKKYILENDSSIANSIGFAGTRQDTAGISYFSNQRYDSTFVYPNPESRKKHQRIVAHYNSLDHISKVYFYTQDGSLVDSSVYKYDDKNRLVSTLHTHRNELVKYEYFGENLYFKKEYRFVDGKTSYNGAYRYEFYPEENAILSYHKIKSFAQPEAPDLRNLVWEKKSKEFYLNGLVIRKKGWIQSDGKNEMVSDWIFRFDDNGLELGFTSTFYPNEDIQESTLTYQDNKLIRRHTEHRHLKTGELEFTFIHTFEYNRWGDLTQKTRTGGIFSLISYEYVYDKQHNWIERKTFGKKGLWTTDYREITYR